MRWVGHGNGMDEQQELAAQVAAAARRQRLRVAVAESLTGGMIASRLAAAADASSWFCGAIVAYTSEVKRKVLQVPAGPVVSQAAATAMATGVAALLGADSSLAITGVGGPQPQDDQPPGTVWLAVHHVGQQHAQLRRLDGGSPLVICERACTEALRLLAATLGA